MGESLEYPDVLQEVRGAMNPGRLKLQSNNIIFKNLKTGKLDQFASTDVEAAKWLIRARGHCLKIVLNNGTVHRFDGFRESEYDKLSSFVKKFYNTSLDKVDMSLKGWNWGTAKFIGNSLDFEVGKGVAFEVPLGNVSHSVTNKNEVTLEFHQNDDAAVSLTELRFHVPADTSNSENPVEDFYNNIIAKADIIQATGESIALFSDVQCLTPRGRYDIKMYPTFLQLHGKTFDYKIPYTTILRLFLLPHKDQRQMFFVVSLDPPIKQGQTRYHFLILLFSKDDETTLELGLSEEDLKSKYDGRLSATMSGNEYEVVSRIMKALVNRKITVPGSFTSHQKSHCVGCSYKAGTGLLYPLERGFIFVHKPAIHIRFDEIASVNFARSTSNLKSFDFEVDTKAGTVYTFVGMEKDEYSRLFDFVSQKKLRVKNIGSNKSNKANYDDMIDSDEEGEHDAYLERMKEEGKEREDEEDDDDDSSSDEDFQAPEDSGSEVAEEYDTDAASTSSEGSDSDAPKEKKEKPPKKKVKTIREKPPQERKKRKPKKEVDPDKPKRPQTAYFLWFNETRPKLKEKYPDLSVSELAKKAGEAWKLVEDKSKWEKLNKEAKAAYDVAMKEYKEKQKDNPPPPKGTPEKKKRSKPKVNSSPAKSPLKDTKAGSGANYKSKEFISDSESAESSTDEDDKPLKRKPKEESSSDDDKPLKKAKKESEEEEVDELPEDEEILSSPTASEDEGSESGSESGSASEDEDD